MGQQLAKNKTLQQWSISESSELYGIRDWGAGYFDITSEGDVAICPFGSDQGTSISIPRIIREMKERGLELPVLLRIENLLDAQISSLHQAFQNAISKLGYKGDYRGVFPIKVNQQQQVLEKIADSFLSLGMS